MTGRFAVAVLAALPAAVAWSAGNEFAVSDDQLARLGVTLGKAEEIGRAHV